MAQRKLEVVITGENRGAKKAFADTTADANTFAGKLAGIGSKITPAMAVAAGAVVAGVGLALKSTITAASDLEQAVGGTTAVFGQASGEVDRFAGNAAELVGLSESAARALTSQLGASLKGFGLDAQEAATRSVELTEIGADLAATMGGTTQEAVEALGAAFRGEFDPLERFGIALKQSDINAKAVAMGLARSESDVSAYARGQAALALITDKAAFAQGQFARESDTVAGASQIARAKLQDASATIGQTLIPMVAQGAEVVSTLVSGFTALPTPVQQVTLGIAGFVAAGSGGMVVVAKLADMFGDVLTPVLNLAKSGLDSAALGAANLMVKMGGSQDSALKLASGISGLSSAAGPALAAAMAVATGAFIGFSIIQDINAKKAAEQRKRAEEFTAAIQDQTGVLEDNINAVIAQQFANEGVGDIIGNTTADVKLFGDAIVNASDRIKVLSDEADTGRLDNFEDELKKGAAAGDALSVEMLRLKNSGELSTTQLMELSNQLDDTGDAYRDGVAAADLNKGMTEAMASASKTAADAAKENADAIRDASNALREATDPWFAAQSAQTKLAESQAAYNAAVQEFGDGSPEAVAAYRELADSGLSYEGKLLDLAAAQEEGKTSSEDLASRLQALKVYGIDPSSASAAGAAWSFGVLDGAAKDADARNVDIPTTTPGLDDAVRKFNDLAAAIRNAGGSAQVFSFGVGNIVPGPFARAAGGPVEPWSAYRVHDTASPEVLSLSDGTSMLLTGALSGYITNLGTAASPSTGAALADAAASSTGLPAGGFTYIDQRVVLSVAGHVLTEGELLDFIVRGMNEKQRYAVRPILPGVSA